MKKVNIPISVPDNKYCWDCQTVCPQFDNEGGHPTCGFDFYPIDSDKKGRYLKPEACIALKEIR